MNKALLRLLFFVPFLACGSGGIQLSDVVAVPAGDKEGAALSGTFTVFYEIRNDGCAAVSALEIPPSGTKIPLEVAVSQSGGALVFTGIDSTTLRGGIDFDNGFEIGGASLLSKNGEENILRIIRVIGTFEDGDNFAASGEERFQGKIATEIVDCTFMFEITGVRKPS
jgi:hypothetical protein